jgi:hypothetical protein
MELTGAQVTMVERCSATTAPGAARRERGDATASLSRFMDKVPSDATVAGDCHLANNAIAEQAGKRPSHPLQVLARAYGIGVDAEPTGEGR